MAIVMNAIMRKKVLFFEIFLVVVIFTVILLTNQLDFFYGLLISVVNVGVFYGFYFYHKKRISRYPAQALVVVVSSTVARFLLIGGLLVLAFQHPNVAAKSLVLGFVLGQLFFFIHHLLVATNNVTRSSSTNIV